MLLQYFLLFSLHLRFLSEYTRNACYVRCSCTHASTDYFQTVSSLSHSSLSTFFRFFLLVLTLHPRPLTMSRLVRRLTLVVFHGVCVCVARVYSYAQLHAFICLSLPVNHHHREAVWSLPIHSCVFGFFFSAVLSVAPHVTAPYHLFPRLSRFQVRFSFFFFTRHSTNARVKAVPSFKGVCVCLCVFVRCARCFLFYLPFPSSACLFQFDFLLFFFFPLLLLNRVRRSSSDTFLRCVDLWV